MSTPDNFTPRSIEREETRARKERNVLRAKVAGFAGAVVIALGALVGHGANKNHGIDNNAQETTTSHSDVERMNTNDLFKYFEGQTNDTIKANFAATIILGEMDADSKYLQSVELNSGTNSLGGNARLDVSRDSLTKILNATRSEKLRILFEKIRKNGKYTRADLVEILSLTTV